MKFKNKIEAQAGLQLSTGATDTYVLTSDALGNGSWAAASGGGGSATIIDDVTPTVVVGGTWFDPTTAKLSVGVDVNWVEIVGKVEELVIVSDTSPALTTGKLWWQPTTSRLHIAVSGAWVQAMNALDSSGGGGLTGPLTLKGDIWIFGTTDEALPVGVDGQTLIANSSTSSGLEWVNNGAEAYSSTTVISLTKVNGAYYDMAAANASTTYTTSGTTLGSFACVLINAATEPVVTGATKIKGSDFIASTDMHLWVQYFGVTVQYFFLEL